MAMRLRYDGDVYVDGEHCGSLSSTFPLKSNCSYTGSTSLMATDVIHKADQIPYNDRSLTKPVVAPASPAVDLIRVSGQSVSDDEQTKLPVNLKLNGIVQLDEGPLDLSVSRRGAAERPRRCAADDKPEAISASSRLRSSKLQALTSASLARLVKRFGLTSSSASTSGTSSVVGSDSGGGRSIGRVSHDASSLESSARPRPETVAQLTSLLNPIPTPASLLTSPAATTFGPAPTSRWRRDSFWANGGWLAGATVASSSLIADRLGNRKRPQPAATSDSGSADGQTHAVDAQSIKRNRKLLSDHRKSSQRSSTRLRCDRTFSTSSQSDCSSRALKVRPPRGRETNGALYVDRAITTQLKDSTPTSPKLPRSGDNQDTMTLLSEPPNVEKKKRQDFDGAGVSAVTPIPVRSNLTCLRCGSCGAQFESLYCLTVHLEETGHKPASDVTVLPIPSPATSPSSTDRKPAVASSAATPPASAPQRLVRGQDVWLARGVEQTDRILRCIQCNAPARSLAELTLHMVHTKHYVNIVGPASSPTANVVSCDLRQRPAAVPLPTALRDKSTDTVALRAKNGMRTVSNREHGLTNAKIRCRDRYDNSSVTVAGDNQTISRQRSNFLQGCAVRENDTDKSANKDRNKNKNSAAEDKRLAVCNAAAESKDAVHDGKLRTTERAAAFSVRNLIASAVDGDSSRASPLSAAALQLPLATASSSQRSHRHDDRSMTSSVGPEVTSSSDERRSPVTVAESVSGRDVISA